MNEPNLKPSRRRVPKPIEQRTGQNRLPGAVVTRDFLQAVHDYCAVNNIEMSDLIRELVAEKIGYKGNEK